MVSVRVEMSLRTGTIHEQYPELAKEQPVHEDTDEAAAQLVQLHMPRSDC